MFVPTRSRGRGRALSFTQDGAHRDALKPPQMKKKTSSWASTDEDNGEPHDMYPRDVVVYNIGRIAWLVNALNTNNVPAFKVRARVRI